MIFKAIKAVVNVLILKNTLLLELIHTFRFPADNGNPKTAKV